MSELRAENVLYSLHVSTARTWRGGENQLYLLARGLLERGQRVLIAAPPGAPLLERAAAVGIPTHALKLSGSFDPLGALRLAKLLQRERPDVLHLHDGHAILPGRWAARAVPRASLSVVAHRRTAFRVKGRAKFTGRVERVIAISQAVKTELLAASVPEQNIAVVYSGLEFPEPLPRTDPSVQELRKSLGLDEKDLLFAHAAALTEEKRQADLIAAFKLCINRGLEGDSRAIPQAHLVLAGTGVLESELRRLVEAQGLAKFVHFTGFLREVRPLWGAADAAVFCSELEGLCTALIEAQGAGLPAVITRAGGMSEVIEENVTGLAVPVGNVDELAGAMLKLAQAPELRSRLGQAAVLRARKVFSKEAMVDGILSVYRELKRQRSRQGVQ